MTDTQQTQLRVQQITPELLWSKYSVIQHVIFWALGLGTWYGLHWLANTYEKLTIPIWRYVSRIHSFTITGDISKMATWGIIAGIVILGLILLADYLIARVKHKPPTRQILRNYFLLPRTPKQEFTAFLVGVNAGIFEELFFRGGIFTLLFLLTHSLWIAILITSLFFATLHAPIQGWLSTLWIFVIGIFLNIFMLETGNFYAPIFCHITINIGNLFIVPALFQEQLETMILEENSSDSGQELPT